MSQIKISCVGSKAIFTNTPDIFSGGNVNEVKFEFDKEWVNLPYKSAVFYINPKETSLQILDANNVARIPSDILSKKGKLSIGVVATNDNGDVKTSKILTYFVGKGAITDDLEITKATPDIWLQMLTIVQHNKEIVDNMNLLVDESQLPNKANKDLSNVSVSTLKNKYIGQMTVGTYVGTGTIGQSNPTIITTNFKPRFLIVSDTDGTFPYDWVHMASEYSLRMQGQFSGVCRLTWGENSVSWYDEAYTPTNGSTPKNQLNESGKTYAYIILG